MLDQPTRRDFLRGGRSGPPAIRPPGAGPEPGFSALCTKCGDCEAACPEAIIHRDATGFPVVDPARGACTFCLACTGACPSGALTETAPWPWRAEASEGCLARHGVECRACEDHCDASAIRFLPMLGGRSEPVFLRDACTGCGGCVAPCPAGAIRLAPTGRPTEAGTTPC